MKNRLFILIIGLTILFPAFATDHVVQEGGATGTFASIGSAITTAVDGDRIIIHPKVGGNPWIENVIINKSLELISSQDGTMYKVQGDIEIIAQNGRKVTVIGAHLVSGNIKGITSGNLTHVNILACQLDGGHIVFNSSYNSTIVSNILLNGYINISKGDVIGNELLVSNINISTSGISTDTINVIANKVSKITCNYAGVINIINNLIYNNVSQSDFYSIRFLSVPLSGKIVNNTIGTPASTSSNTSDLNYFIYDFNIYGAYDNLLIQNNIFAGTTGSVTRPGLVSRLLNSTAASNYNYYYAVLSNQTISNNPFEITLTSNPINTTGVLILPTAAQNGANPAFEFYDLDLTVGDAGCYGGSYSIDNYFPITGSSRVFNIDMPFGIISGGTLNIKATGFDK